MDPAGVRKMKGREREIGQTPCHVISSHSLCERIIQIFDNREIQPSQISLDARYSMKCVVWREAVCKLCDLRDQPAFSLPDVREIGVTHFHILCQASL